MSSKTITTIPSTHDVYKEYMACMGNQKIPLADLFIRTMTHEDMAKITIQLIEKQCAETSISEGDSYRRKLDNIIWNHSSSI